MKVVFKVPVKREREFSYIFAVGAKPLGVTSSQDMFFSQHFMLFAIEPSEQTERLSFFRVSCGEEFDQSDLTFLGVLPGEQSGELLFMRNTRTPIHST